eukprot:Rhum_TRINITY_DN14488_c9_g1::Rhum_TRINITY_DN14488_c9_g1_i1::g.92639::m.92639
MLPAPLLLLLLLLPRSACGDLQVPLHVVELPQRAAQAPPLRRLPLGLASGCDDVVARVDLLGRRRLRRRRLVRALQRLDLDGQLRAALLHLAVAGAALCCLELRLHVLDTHGQLRLALLRRLQQRRRVGQRLLQQRRVLEHCCELRLHLLKLLRTLVHFTVPDHFFPEETFLLFQKGRELSNLILRQLRLGLHSPHRHQVRALRHLLLALQRLRPLLQVPAVGLQRLPLLRRLVQRLRQLRQLSLHPRRLRLRPRDRGVRRLRTLCRTPHLRVLLLKVVAQSVQLALPHRGLRLPQLRRRRRLLQLVAQHAHLALRRRRR